MGQGAGGEPVAVAVEVVGDDNDDDGDASRVIVSS